MDSLISFLCHSILFPSCHPPITRSTLYPKLPVATPGRDSESGCLPGNPQPPNISKIKRCQQKPRNGTKTRYQHLELQLPQTGSLHKNASKNSQENLSPSEPSNPTTVGPEDFKIAIMNVFKDLKEDMNESFNEVCESTQWNEIQDLDVEIRSL